MRILKICQRQGRKDVTFVLNGEKEPKTEKFPETMNQKQIEEALAKKFKKPGKPDKSQPATRNT